MASAFDEGRRQEPSLRTRAWITDYFGRRLSDELGYIWQEPVDQVAVIPSHGTPLYDLAFFSRDKLGIRFARDAKRGITPQRPLF